MASLIKPNIKPQKWLKKQRDKINSNNKIITIKHLAKLDKKNKQFDLTRARVRSQIKQYYDTKKSYIEAGMKRGSRGYKANLAAQTIGILMQWQINLKKETHAINMLAQKIALNISNDSQIPAPIAMVDSEQELSSLLKWQIIIPENAMITIKKRIEHLPINISPFIKTHQQETGALLFIDAIDASYSFDFHEGDIGKIFAKVASIYQEQSP